MFDEHKLSAALDLHQRTYQLLLWVDREVRVGKLSFERAHASLNAASAALDWIESNYLRLPKKFRPRSIARTDLLPFANLFASYLATSFDAVEAPGTRPASDCGCTCDFCARMVSLPLLKPKRLTRSDKQEAHNSIRRYVEDLTAEVRFEPSQLDLVLATVEAQAALCVWAQLLGDRIAGQELDVSALALWRMFAWTPTGAPRRDFSVSPSDVVGAEAAVREAIRAAREPSS